MGNSAFRKNNMEAQLKETLKIKVPKSVIAAIPRFDQLEIREIVYYLNTIRTLHSLRANYFPNCKVKTEVNFFKSTDDKIVDDESLWNNYCINEIKRHEVSGKHVTIFQIPYVNQFSNILNRLLI